MGGALLAVGAAAVLVAAASCAVAVPAPRCTIAPNEHNSYFIQTGGVPNATAGWDGGWDVKCCRHTAVYCFWFPSAAACAKGLHGKEGMSCLPCATTKNCVGCPQWDCGPLGSPACKPVNPPGPRPAPPGPPAPHPAPPGPPAPPPSPPKVWKQPTILPISEVAVKNPKKLPPRLPAPGHSYLGILGDLKPFITLLKNGELLIVSGVCGNNRGGSSEAAQDCATICEDGRCGTTPGGINQTQKPVASWRSSDNGVTWTERQLLLDSKKHFLPVGEEIALHTVSDGTVLLLGESLVYRSTNHGVARLPTAEALPGRGALLSLFLFFLFILFGEGGGGKKLLD